MPPRQLQRIRRLRQAPTPRPRERRRGDPPEGSHVRRAAEGDRRQLAGHLHHREPRRQADGTREPRGRRRGGGVREQVGLHHRPHHHGPPGAGGGGRGRLVLAHGVPPEAEARRASASPAGVPQPSLHHAGAPGGALAGLLLVSVRRPSSSSSVVL